MLKKINRSNVTVKPFSTFKHWDIDTTTDDFLLLQEDGYDITLYDLTGSCGALIESGNIAIQDQVYNSQEYSVEGRLINGIFYNVGDSLYSSSENPINWDNSYKRVVYSTLNSMFYEFSNPMYQFGVEHAEVGPNGEKENRNINGHIVSLNIGQQFFGEEIEPGTLKMQDFSNGDDVYYIEDDGYTNLNLIGQYFSSIQQIQPPLNFPGQTFYDPEHDRFGYVVAAWSNYILVGCPMDENSMDNSQAGSAFLYRIDPATNEFRFIKKFLSPFSQNGFAEEQQWDSTNILMTEIGFFLLEELNYSLLDKFGISVSINNDFMAIGSPQADYCGSSGSAGQVYVYDKYKGGFDHWGIDNVLEGSASYDNFGISVHLSGSKLAIGADNAYGSKGAVYIFERFVYGTTVPTSSFWYKIDPENAWCEDLFDESGSIEIYSEINTPYFITGNNTWILQHVITSSEWASGSKYGGVVRIDRDRLIIGSKRLDQSSSVYLFQYDASASGTGLFDTSSFDGPEGNLAYGSGSWIQTFKFTNQGIWSGSVFTSHSIDLIGTNAFFNSPPSLITIRTGSDGFGNSLAIKGNYIVIGAPYDRDFFEYSGSDTSYLAGAAYILQTTGSTWVAQEKLFGEDLGDVDISSTEDLDSFNNRFGTDVSINSNRIVVGSPSPPYDIQNSYTSSIILFEDHLTSSNRFVIDEFYSNSRNASDHDFVNGRAFIYKLNTSSLGWDFEKVIKKNKYQKQPKYYYGNSVSLTEDKLVVGAPIFSYTNLPSSSLDPMFISSTMPNFESGSAFYYNLNDLDIDKKQIGNVFYKNGVITNVATESAFINIFQRNVLTKQDCFGFSASYQGHHTIYENEVLCSIAPGEFNVSTNPTAVYRFDILYDINQDGIFDLTDIDLIMKYFQKDYNFVSGSSDIEVPDDNTLEEEDDDSWWKDDMFLMESEDTILLETWVSSSLQSQQIQVQQLNQDYYDRIHQLDINGYLDVDLNGVTDTRDALLILRYYLGNTGTTLTENLIDINSQRRYSNQIREYLDKVTGRHNGIRIKDEFLNYRESSSLDKTGSFLAPFATIVGLYQDELLVAVGKLARPLKMSSDFPINIAVRWDGI